MRFVLTVLISAVGLAVAAWLFPDIYVQGDDDGQRVLTLLIVALIFGLVNTLVRPVVKLVALPLYLLTLGLIAFVINALMLMLTSWVADQLDVGFGVDGFWTALGGSLVISFITAVLTTMIKDGDRR